MFCKTCCSTANRATIAIILCILSFSAYWQVIDNQFILYDDDIYILDNPMLRMGLNFNSIIWAFTSYYGGNWHPLTWLSHLLDFQLFGTNPAGHHFVNLALHTVNTVILFFLLNRLTGIIGRSALVAALFALHPLHVESVAWAAERKDVLSSLFWMLTVYCYSNYVIKQKTCQYILSIAMFAFGLMAKPMLVTLPFVLLLLDYWPLKRFITHHECGKDTTICKSKCFLLWHLLREKAPFMVLVFFSCIFTIIAQEQGRSIASLSILPLWERIENASVVYIRYLGKVFMPHNLAVFYPFPKSIPLLQTFGSIGFLTVVTVLLYRQRNKFPYLIVGWTWYIVTLIPVIGIVQVGLQSMADRYTYIPLTGIFILLVWSFYDFSENWIYRRTLLTILSILILTVCLVITRKQVSYWHDTKSLFTHAVSVTHDNFVAHSILGYALEKEGKLTEALLHFNEAATIAPWFKQSKIHQDIIIRSQGLLDTPVIKQGKAINKSPESAIMHLNLGIVMALQGKLEDARTNFEISLEFNPQSAVAHYNLGLVLSRLGRMNEAIIHFTNALDIDPMDAECHNNFGVALMNKGEVDKAVQHFSEAIRIDPKLYDAINNKKLALKTIRDKHLPQ